MTSEVLALIAVCISGITSICAATIPAILNYRSKKEELRVRTQREEQQAYEAKFEKFYIKHLKIVIDFPNLYESWKIDRKNSAPLLKFIKEVAPEFRYSINNWLYKFADKITNFPDSDDLDKDFKRCMLLILDSYGARISGDTPNYLLSEMLRVVLKERFDELQHATSKDFHFHSI